MTRLALISVNAKSSHSNPTLYYMRNLLQQQSGFSSVIIELTINMSWKECLEKLTAEFFDYALFSVYIWNSEFIGNIAELLAKINPEIKLIAGGPEITYNTRYWKDHSSFDLLVTGQAEGFIQHYFLQTENRDSFLQNGIFSSPHKSITESIFPYAEEDHKHLSGQLVYYEASRGCRFSCSYCLSACENQIFEYKKVETVKKDLLKLSEIKPKTIKFVDRTFNADKEFSREIWQFLIDQNFTVPVHFEIHPVYLETKDLNLFRKMPPGILNVEVGIQSTNKEVLHNVNRAGDWQKEKKILNMLCTIPGIHTHLDQIAGLPGDTPETAVESFNNILSLEPDDFQLGFLKVLPGTPLEERVEEFGIKKASFPPYEIVKTADMDFNFLKILYRIEKLVRYFYNSDYFENTFSCFLKQMKPWDIFSRLDQLIKEENYSKQWTYLGKCLFDLANELFSENILYIKDLLRLDWCPYAKAQGYPYFLQGEDFEEIKKIRRKVFYHLSENRSDFSRVLYNHSILFIPRTDKLRNELKNKAVLFYKQKNSKPLQLTVDINVFNNLEDNE